jgi:hypothetical protein
MASDISIALRSDLTHGGKFDVLNNVMWAWTEYDGKYLGCPYWTRSAIDVYRRAHNFKDLRHEHVVPKKCLMAMLFNLPDPTSGIVLEMLSRYLIGVIVTRDEDALLGIELSKSMPAQFEGCADVMARDPWLRYKLCKIDWVDVNDLPEEHELRRVLRVRR